MNFKDKIEYLKQYAMFQDEAEKIRQEFLYWRQRAREHRGDDDSTVCIIGQIAYYSKLLLGKYQACLGRRIAIEESILSCENERYRMILRRRFIDKVMLNTLAEELGICDRHMMRLYRKALDAIEVPDKALWEASFTLALSLLTPPEHKWAA